MSSISNKTMRIRALAAVQQDRLEYYDDTSSDRKSLMAPNVALGDFLRARRERLDAAALGHSTLRRRRTPGLRREEVADAAGISVEWYVKLEQGRAIAPPAATIDALARALCLGVVDTAHLNRLAGAGNREFFQRERLPAPLRRLVDGLPHPAYITGQRWDLLGWNTAAAELFGDFDAAHEGDRNILHHMLTRGEAKILFGAQWASEARRMVALFRATFDLWATDPAFIGLVVRLADEAPAFTGWWSSHDIAAPMSGVKTLHLARGQRRYEYATFQANDDPALKLAIYSPC